MGAPPSVHSPNIAPAALRDERRGRFGFLLLGVLLSATAVAAAGTIGIVGLVAPHAARALVGRQHTRVIPVAVLLGAVLVRTADLVGRTVIAPAQLGAGLMTAVIGTPYFLHLLVRSRRQLLPEPAEGRVRRAQPRRTRPSRMPQP